MASTDVNELFGAATEFAELMLRTEGEFIPFGVSMATDGSVAMVGGDVGSEHPRSVDVISLLQLNFLEQLLAGTIRAAGICLDVRVIPPGQDVKSDAISVRLAHSSGEALEVFVPYAGSVDAGFTFGSPFATQAGEFRHNAV